jgi:hypothetical protein
MALWKETFCCEDDRFALRLLVQAKLPLFDALTKGGHQGAKPLLWV